MKTLEKFGATLALLALLAVVAAPGRMTGQINLDLDKGIKAGQHLYKAVKPMSYKQEQLLGRQVAARIAGTFGIWEDKDWTLYINKVGRALAPYSVRPDIKYRFAILDTDDVNAYSAPAGYIFISRGMLKELESESQLAGVLGHEIAHVARKHIVKEVQKSNLYQAGAIVALEAANVDSEAEAALGKLTDLSWDYLINKGFSKEDEYDSDATGMKNAWRMGYNPSGLRDFLATLQKQETGAGAKMKILLSTHPKPSNRLAELDKAMTKKKLAAENRKDNKERFQDFKAKHPIP